MINGAMFDHDEVVRFGYPWHGLFKNGVVTLPNASTRSIDGDAPNDGCCFVVKKPGQAAVTTSTEDAAAGMTWLNYGVIYGDNKCFYGKSLGDLSWIWIDDSGVPWLATITKNATWDITVNVQKFGEITGTAEAHSETISLPSYPNVPAFPNDLCIDDIDSVGRQVALVARELVVPANYPAGWVPSGIIYRRVWRIWLLTLSGTGDALSLSVSLKSDALFKVFNETASSPIPETFWKKDLSTSEVTGPFSGNHPQGDPNDGYAYCYSATSGTLTHHWEVAAGATLVDDTFCLVFYVTDETIDVTITPDMSTLFKAGAEWEPDNGSGRWWWRMSEESDFEHSGTYGISVNGNVTSWDFTGDLHLVDGVLSDSGYSNFTIASEDASPIVSGQPAQLWEPVVRRLGNRVYGVSYHRFVNLGIYTPNQVLWVAVGGHAEGVLNPFWGNTLNPMFATSYPVTGSIETDTGGVVCWV